MLFYKKESGATLVITAIVLFALLGITALAIDVGRLYVAKQHAQNVCDSAAMAGAPMLTGKPECTSSSGLAATAARVNAASNNQVTPAWLVLVAGSTSPGVLITFPSGTVADDAGRSIPVKSGEAIKAEGYVNVSLLFARIFGRQNAAVPASSTAILEEASYVASSLYVPLSISSTTLLGGSGVPPIAFGEQATMKVDMWQQDFLGSGNFGPLDFSTLAGGGGGGSTYRQLLAGRGGVYGISAGGTFWIPTLPGSKVGPTWQGLQDRLDAEPLAALQDDRYAWQNWLDMFDENTGLYPNSTRIILVPVVDVETTPVNGKKSVKVIGMAGFFIEHVTSNKEEPNDEFKTVTGRFIQGVVTGQTIRWIIDIGETADSPQTILVVRLVS